MVQRKSQLEADDVKPSCSSTEWVILQTLLVLPLDCIRRFHLDIVEPHVFLTKYSY